MNYAVLLGSIVAVHLLALVSPGPSVLVVTKKDLKVKFDRLAESSRVVEEEE